jgi:ATP-binding protein involved in chromosome partitioning
MEFLGEIPLDTVIRQTSDDGHPIVAADPEGEHARTYLAIAAKVWETVEQNLQMRAASAPRIVIQ